MERPREVPGAESPVVSSRGTPEEPEQAPRPIVVSPPPDPVTATMRLSGCSPDDPDPVGLGFDAAIRLVQDELWDRAITTLRGTDGSPALREGLQGLFTREGVPDDALRSLSSAPDRRDGEYDYAAAGAFVVAVRRAARGEDADEAMALLAGRLLEPLARAARARFAGDSDAELNALRESLRLDPEQPGVALGVTVLAMQLGDSAVALDALEHYAGLEAADPWIALTRERLELRVALEAPMIRRERAGVSLAYARVIASNDADRVHAAIVEALDESAALLGTPRRPKLQVFVYADAADYRRATCGPGWSSASFDGALRIPGGLVGAEREEPTLRHESLHAQLAFVAPGAPLWLHEGLAQLFEGDAPVGARRSLELMARQGSYVPFPSMEGSFVVIEDPNAARFAYHQSYAMVAAAMDREPDAIPRAVHYLSQGEDPSGVLEAMSDRPLTGADLLEWARAQLRE